MHLKLLNNNALLILVCIITRVVTIQITNQSKVLISFGKKEPSILEHIAQTVLLMQIRKKLVIKEHIKQRRLLNLKKKACESQSSVMKHYRTNSKASCIQGFIYKFHNIVSQGPMLICSCCDQLWYRQCQLSSQTNKIQSKS